MKDKFTVRERVALKLIFMALTIVKPFAYDHQLTKPLEEIEKLIKAEA